ncbi:MAG: phage major capsid protein [Clostridia bacterium]|nr:phage major capsid protein [Clostridia bacterium]
MPAFDNISLEKGLYTSGNFTSALSGIDPDENYKGTPLEGLDAFQRQLKRFDIKVNGPYGDTVEKFFSTSQSSVLFPEFVARAVKTGMEQADILPEIVAATTVINSPDYRSLSSVPTEDEKELKAVAEGAFIPETQVRTKSNLVSLRKRGRSLVASYEAIKYQRIDLFTITLRQIGAYIARSLLKDAVDVLTNGDGNNNAAPVTNTAVSSSLSYTDLVGFWNSFDPYEMNMVIASPDMMAKLLSMTEFRDGAAGLTFHSTGNMITPFGSKLLKVSALNSGKLIGLDKGAALEMIKTGDIMTEYDKLIDRQLDRAVISCTAGFAKICDDSAKVLSI